MKGSVDQKKVRQENPPIGFQCFDAIQLSLFIEKQGLVFYEKAAKNAGDPEIKAVFSRLAEEEKEHIQSLQAKARFLQPVLLKKSNLKKNADVDLYIAREVKGKVFPEVCGKGEKIPEPANDMEALEFGIESEKRSIEVLSRLLIEERKIDVRVIFSHLVVEEKRHLAELEKLKQNYLSSGKGGHDK